MTDTPEASSKEIEAEIQEIAVKLERLSLTPASSPSISPSLDYIGRPSINSREATSLISTKDNEYMVDLHQHKEGSLILWEISLL